MEHITLFLYFIFLASGFAGITVTLLLNKRLHSTVLGWFSGIMGLFTLWLVLTLLLFYAEKIIMYPFPTGKILGVLNLILGVVVYAGLVVCNRKVYPAGRPVWLIISLLPFSLFYLIYIAANTFLSSFSIPLLSQTVFVTVVSVFCSALFLTYTGVAFIRGGAFGKQETLRFLFRWIGTITLVFAPASLVVTVIGLFAGVEEGSTVPLNYLYFFSWNVLAVIAFIRYLAKPSQILSDGTVGLGFQKQYGISRREAEIIECLARGVSNKEIAEELHISFTTVRTHVYNIYKKTGAGNRVELLQMITGYKE